MQKVQKVGCGTGRNFPYLREAIGPTRRIYGVDLSAGMLRKARKLSDHHHWTNIHLTEGDAANYVAPEPLDGVLFSLSYNTMPHHLTVLRRIWKQLRPGGRLVIMDSKLPPGLGGKLLLPFSLWMMRSRWQLADRVATIDRRSFFGGRFLRAARTDFNALLARDLVICVSVCLPLSSVARGLYFRHAVLLGRLLLRGQLSCEIILYEFPARLLSKMLRRPAAALGGRPDICNPLRYPVAQHLLAVASVSGLIDSTLKPSSLNCSRVHFAPKRLCGNGPRHP